MYGGSSKVGRAGGGGGGRGGKRPSFPPPSSHRTSTPAGGRLSLGSSAGGRNRNNTNSGPSATSANSSSEETFSIVPGNNPPAFGMIIRLAPDLIDEIKRVEAQGGTAKIKFDSNANNANENVIGVGGKDFRFTWSREMGDLCDIYEERPSDGDGNGLLVESGCAWRKLNVQRILDESTTNHVKMRSEEAERRLKSRRAIVLDHGNPSMKNQIKAVAAAEASPWKMPFKQKNEAAFKKRKVEPPQAPPPPKSTAYKSGGSWTSAGKGRQSASPLPSSPNQSVAPASPFGTGNRSKSHESVEDVVPTPITSKPIIASSEKEIPSRATSAVQGTPVSKGKLGATPMDLQSMLITLLTENAKGMSLKALEKAVGDTVPNSIKKIEPIIKKIATFQAPGRYILKPGIELESFKKPLTESGSSPEDTRHRIPASEDNHNQTPAPELSFVEKIPTNEYQEEAQLNSKLGENSTMVEKIDILQPSPDLFGDKRASDNSEGQAGSSSNSGSDSGSDSDSSDSGSDSRSHSRSRSRSRSKSPVGSGSGSSSDSESDASSDSKEGSDEDVDIMTSDDDKEQKHSLKVSEPGLSVSPIPWRPDGVPVQNEFDGRQTDDGFDAIDIERILPVEQETEMTAAAVTNSVPSKETEKPLKDTKPYSPDLDECQERQNFIGSLFNEKENMVKDGFKHEQSDSSERISKGKSKRGSDEKSERGKRFKAGSLPQPPLSGVRGVQFPGGPQIASPDRVNEDLYKGSNIPMINRSDMDGNADSLHKGYNQPLSGKSTSDFHQPGRRSVEHGGRAKASDVADRPGKHAESFGRGPKYSERSSHAHESFSMQKDKAYSEALDEDTYASEKKVPKNFKEGGFGIRQSMPSDSQYKKHDELVGKFKEAGQISNLHMGSSPKDSNRSGVDRFPVVNGRGSILRRELSDLELGELREPIPEETQGVKKQFERKSSFKHSESKSRSDTWNSEMSKGRPIGKAIFNSGKPSTSNLGVGVPSNSELVSKKRTPEHYVEDMTRPQHKVVQSQSHQLSGVDHAEVGAQSNKLAEGNCRQSESGKTEAIGLEGYGDTHKKAPFSEMQQRDIKRGLPSSKENIARPSHKVAVLSNGLKEAALLEDNNGVQKTRESSSDENSCYSKYEKDEPELKGPIKDFSQYKEYVQEYRDKYDTYCSLNKILETYRNDFQKLGKSLEFSKDQDKQRYYNLLGQLKNSYEQCGPKHRRYKKIFVVLHEELKTLKQRIKDFAFSYRKD